MTLGGPGQAGSSGADRRAFTGAATPSLRSLCATSGAPARGRGAPPCTLCTAAPGGGARQWGVVAELPEASCRPLGERGGEGRPEEASEAEGRGQGVGAGERGAGRGAGSAQGAGSRSRLEQ